MDLLDNICGEILRQEQRRRDLQVECSKLQDGANIEFAKLADADNSIVESIS